MASTPTATAPSNGTPNGSDPQAVLDTLKPPQGVVLPPREIRNILEKTAGFVARNGATFEDRVRDKERQNPKFSFLSPNDAYHAYYTWRLSEIRDGRGTAIAAGRVGEAAVAAKEKPKGPPKPPDFAFSARMPRINQKDLEVVRLTALFVAKNGRQFMTQLAQREAGKPQFQFLMPNHTFHSFFQNLVDQYTELLRASGLDGEGGKVQQERIDELQENTTNKWHVLARAKQRAEYAKFQESEKQKKDEEEEKKKIEFASVDWSDFVVVETIVFTDADEQANLPPPTSLSELQYASLEDRRQVSINANFRIEEAMPTDEDDFSTSYTAPAPVFAPAPPQQYPLPVHTGNAPQQPAAPTPVSKAQQAQAEEENRRIQERRDAQARQQQAHAEARGGNAPIKIKENYVPKAAQKAAADKHSTAQLCPYCNQMIPVDEMKEHLRIELLDPRWKEQKAKSDARSATTNLNTADVANNLKRLASQRSDVFDTVTGQPLADEEAARQKKIAHGSNGAIGVTYGAEHPSIPMIGPTGASSLPPPPGLLNAAAAPGGRVDVQEQIRAIREKFGADRK